MLPPLAPLKYRRAILFLILYLLEVEPIKYALGQNSLCM